DLLIGTRGDECGFVDQICEIRTSEAGRSAGDDIDIDAFIQRDFPRVNFQDTFAAANVRIRHDDLAVKSAGTKQRRIEHVRTVRRSHQNDAVVRFETVHFDQKLVERLFAFIVTAAESCSAVTPDGIDLVNKDYARRVLFALFEQVAYARRADADEHFDKIRTGDRKERNVRFACDGFRQKRFAGSRR